jgi:hypothetical protein
VKIRARVRVRARVRDRDRSFVNQCGSKHNETLDMRHRGPIRVQKK